MESSWESDNQDGGTRAVWQRDGNLVIYNGDDDNYPVWASETSGNSRTVAIQDDGKIVIYDELDQPLWATNTQHV